MMCAYALVSKWVLGTWNQNDVNTKIWQNYTKLQRTCFFDWKRCWACHDKMILQRQDWWSFVKASRSGQGRPPWMGLNWRQGFEIIQCLPSFVQALHEDKNANTGLQDSHLAILGAFARTKLKSSEEEAKKNTVRGPNCRSWGSWTMPRRRCLYPFQVPSAACAVLDHFSQQEMTPKETIYFLFTATNADNNMMTRIITAAATITTTIPSFPGLTDCPT